MKGEIKLKRNRSSFSAAAVKERVFFGLLFLLVFLLSATVFPYTGYTGKEAVRIVPDVLFALCFVSGIVCKDRRYAALLALVFGALSDFFLTPPTHLSPILFFLSAYFSSAAVGIFTSVNAVTATVSSLPFFLARSVTGGLFLLTENGNESFGTIVKSILLPELCVNVAVTFIVYLLVGLIARKWIYRTGSSRKL